MAVSCKFSKEWLEDWNIETRPDNVLRMMSENSRLRLGLSLNG
jgi:hypothetical protein